MDRKWKSGAAGGAPALDNASDGYATNGNPGGGIAATVPGAHWYHMITEELLALITDAAIAFDKTVLTQVRDAVRALVANASLPMSEMTFIMANGADATNDIDVSAGKTRSSDDTTNLVGAAMTKQIDAVWAGGTNAGGRIASESLVDGTWHLFAFKRTTGGAGIDYCFSQSLAPTFPDSGVKGRRLLSFNRISGVNQPFKQNGDNFLFGGYPALDVSTTNPGTAAVLATLAGLPNGIRVRAMLGVNITNTTPLSGLGVLFSSPDVADVAPSITVSPLSNAGEAASGIGSLISSMINCWTNASRQIRYRAASSDAGFIIRIQVHGFTDRRGRDG